MVEFQSVIDASASSFPALGQDEANKQNTNWPEYREGDYVIHDYKFVSGESLPEVKLHYRTIGTAIQNAAGEGVNAVLLLQGNTGTGANWFRPTLADELFKPDQPLDPAKYYIIIPDAPAGHRRAEGRPRHLRADALLARARTTR